MVPASPHTPGFFCLQLLLHPFSPPSIQPGPSPPLPWPQLLSINRWFQSASRLAFSPDLQAHHPVPYPCFHISIHWTPLPSALSFSWIHGLSCTKSFVTSHCPLSRLLSLLWASPSPAELPGGSLSTRALSACRASAHTSPSAWNAVSRGPLLCPSLPLKIT